MPSILAKNPARLEWAAEQILKLPASDKAPVEISWGPYKNTRTEAANRLYFAWVSHVATTTGNDKEAIHEAFKARFLGAGTLKVGKKRMSYIRSSKALTVAEFTEYLTRIQAWCGENGIILPTNANYERLFK